MEASLFDRWQWDKLGPSAKRITDFPVCKHSYLILFVRVAVWRQGHLKSASCYLRTPPNLRYRGCNFGRLTKVADLQITAFSFISTFRSGFAVYQGTQPTNITPFTAHTAWWISTDNTFYCLFFFFRFVLSSSMPTRLLLPRRSGDDNISFPCWQTSVWVRW